MTKRYWGSRIGKKKGRAGHLREKTDRQRPDNAHAVHETSSYLLYPARPYMARGLEKTHMKRTHGIPSRLRRRQRPRQWNRLVPAGCGTDCQGQDGRLLRSTNDRLEVPQTTPCAGDLSGHYYPSDRFRRVRLGNFHKASPPVEPRTI